MATSKNISLGLHILVILVAGIACSIFLCPEQADIKMLFGLYHKSYSSFNQLLFIQFVGVSILYFLSNICLRGPAPITLRTELFKLLLDVTMIFFLLGINLPVIKSVKLGLFDSQTSLLQIIQQLFNTTEYLLFTIMLVFTFIFPIVKLLFLIFNLYSDVELGGTISFLSKWGMADVLIIGIIVAVSKSGNQMFILQSSQGLAFFALSVLLSSVIVHLRK